MNTVAPFAESFTLMEEISRGLEACRSGLANEIHLSSGPFYISPGMLPSKVCNIANHDSGEKKILFDLEGVENVVIDGHGAELMMQGRVIPFYLKNARNITLRNFTIDWVRPFLSQAEILGSGEGYVDLQFSDEYPIEVFGERLCFTGDNFQSDLIDNLLEFDVDSGSPATLARDNFGIRKGYRAQVLGPKQVRLFARFHSANHFVPGNVVVIKHEKRWSPAVVLADCESVTLEDMDIFHAGGMGVIGQNCDGITLSRIRVMPRPNSGRLFSVFVDAFHFVDCRGKVHIHDCVMEGQMDDAINIHGIFLKLEGIESGTTARLRLMHHQQFGVQTLFPGTRAEFVNAVSLEVLGHAQVLEAEMVDTENCRVTFDELPVGLSDKEVLVMRAEPDFDVLIEACRMNDNRSRGVLFNAYGHCQIRNATFRTPWEAIRISGAVDGKWYESGPSQSVEVSGCTFESCGRVNSRPVVRVTAHHTVNGNAKPYHGRVILRDNQFKLAHPNLAAVDNVKCFDFYNNQIESARGATITRGVQSNFGQVEDVAITVET